MRVIQVSRYFPVISLDCGQDPTIPNGRSIVNCYEDGADRSHSDSESKFDDNGVSKVLRKELSQGYGRNK